MKDIFDTRKYLETDYEKNTLQDELKTLKVDIIWKELNFGQKVKVHINSVIAFFFNFMP